MRACQLTKTMNESFIFRPPSFKQVTPSSRTNVRQLLFREQCLQQEEERRKRSSTSTQNVKESTFTSNMTQNVKESTRSTLTHNVKESTFTSTAKSSRTSPILEPTPAISIKRPSDESLAVNRIPPQILKVQPLKENFN